MNEKQLLFEFEIKYPFLYRVEVNRVPLYTCLRDHTLMLLRDGDAVAQKAENNSKGRVFPRRLMDGILKLPQLRRAKTLIFTSSVYRRDHGRNLAAEYLMEHYPGAAVFEWPSRNEAFDRAYFSDPNRERYCPLDFYLVLFKAARLLHRKSMAEKEERLREELRRRFEAAPPPANGNEAAAIRYLLDTLPESYVTTELSHSIFRRLFRGYTSIQYAVDFWGSGRENIFPVLPGTPEKIELQHGLISGTHPGYVYPDFVREADTDFFRRTLLVYGEATKRILCDASIFREEQIKVIGNPRIQMYRRVFGTREQEKSLILFTSQPFEQDGSGVEYYHDMVLFLHAVTSYLKEKDLRKRFQLGIKLHPRETEDVLELYRREVPGCVLFDSNEELFELLSRSYLHLTVSSTTLFEAAEFGVPTVLFAFSAVPLAEASHYGFPVRMIHTPAETAQVLQTVAGEYQKYLSYLQERTKEYM